jgi:hypothetical protein
MISKNIVWRSLLVAPAVILIACQDAPVPTAPATDMLASRSATAQDRLEEIFRRNWSEVMALPGTVFADNDEVAKKLVFGVEHAGAARAVEAVLTRRGVSRSDYAIEVTPPIRYAASLRDVHDPTIGGIQIHFGRFLCTLGFNVTHVSTQAESFITNSHCTNTQGGTEGTLYYQPTSNVDSDAIAIEVDDPGYFKGGVCPKGKKCRYSDASRAEYLGHRASANDIARTTGANNNSLTQDGVFSVVGLDDTGGFNEVGRAVNKVGRTTGWTQGAITRTCVNTSVQGSNVMQLCQTFVNAGVGSGDSGSPVFVEQGGGAKIVGILWGGSSDNRTFVFSPLSQIQQELGQLEAQ